MATNVNDLLKQLQKAEDAYYNKKPIMSDSAYDMLKDKVQRLLPPDHPYLNKVGHVPVSNWTKEAHSMFMGSQNKVSSEEDIKEWVNSIYSQLGTKDVTFIVEHKLDGFSLACSYRGHQLIKGVTRGDGEVGENITNNVKRFRLLPNHIGIDREVEVRCEGIISKSNYAEIQKKTKGKYKNARNAAAGISRRYDGSHSSYVQAVAYDINANVTKESEKIEVLQKLGFSTVPVVVCKTLDEILTYYRKMKEDRDRLPYEIDGLVLKIDRVDLQEQLGIKRNRPEGQVAMKFDSDQALTTIKEIKVQVGRTGKVTPIVILEPADLMGSTVTKATAHNFAYIEANMISPGAEVVIEKKGDIIPQVVEVASPGQPFSKPSVCPSCGGKLQDDGTNLWCYNPGCEERETNRITYWMQTLSMKGFSGGFVKKLWDSGKVKSVGDMYKLTIDDFRAIDGVGVKTVKSFFKILEDTSEMYLDKFIVALGIPTCSTSTADALVKEFETWDRIVGLSADEIASLPGFAETSANAVCEGIMDVKSMAEELLKVIKIKVKTKGVLTGKSFCVTGSLKTMDRKKGFPDLVEKHGGVTKGSVSKGLTYLVTNDTTSGSSKNEKAKKYGVKVITEEEFLNLIGEEIKEPEKKDEGPQLEFEKIF